MSKTHTPGPWTVHPDKLSGDGRAIYSACIRQQARYANDDGAYLDFVRGLEKAADYAEGTPLVTEGKS